MGDTVRIVDKNTSDILLRPGVTFQITSGLGGSYIDKSWQPHTLPQFIKKACKADSVTWGAFFCKYNLNGDFRKAFCWFEDVVGKVWDQFHLRSESGDTNAYAL